MGKLIEITQVSLGGEIEALNAWAFPYLDEQHGEYQLRMLQEADALLLGRRSYEGLSAAYTAMAETGRGAAPEFVARMNSIPKFVASNTLKELSWNATRIDGDIAASIENLKHEEEKNLLKYGNGILDATLMEHGLIDQFHLLLTPAAVGTGTHLFEHVTTAPHLDLVDVTRFDSGLLMLVYSPKHACI